MNRSTRGFLESLRRRWRRRTVSECVQPHAAYELWASSYGEESNEFLCLEADALKGLLPPLVGKSFLDVGCGTGRLSRLALRLGAARAVAIDFSYSMLAASPRAAEHATRAAALLRVQADAIALPVASITFDVVGSALMLGHVRHLAPALAEMRRVLRPGGWLVVSDFHPAATARGWDRSFTDSATGATRRIRQYAHPLHEYRTLLGDLDFVLEHLEEREFEEQTVAFALKARLRPPGARTSARAATPSPGS